MAFETQFEAETTSAGNAGAALPAAAQEGGQRALLGVALVMAIFQIAQGLNSDSSWLMTVADHWLAGMRAYVDILESNPPSSFLPLVPALLLAHLTGLPPEPLFIGLTALAAYIVIEATVRMMQAAGAIDSPERTRLALGFALLVLPLSIFGEREHLAVIAIVPIWAAMIVRAEGRGLPRVLLIAAGLGGGLAMCVKPQFAAAILLPALVVARQQRRFAMLFVPEFWLAACVVGLFALVVVLIFPAYGSQVVPLAIDLYRPIREPFEVLVANDAMVWSVVALVGLALVARGRITEPRIAIPLMAGLGFGLGVIEQGKGFAYHYYPMAAALVPALLNRGLVLANDRFGPGTGRFQRLVAVTGFLLIVVGLTFVTLSFYGISKPMAALVRPINALAPHPRLLSITPHIWVGHPLVRDLGGTWVGSVPNQWMTLGALYKLGKRPVNEQERRRLEAIIAADRVRTTADIALGRPDIVVVEHDDRVFPAWFGSDEELAAFLPDYVRSSTELGILDIWVRRRGPAR